MPERIDPGGARREALDLFLDAKLAEGFEIETHTDVHAIIVEPVRGGLRSRLGRSGGEARRHVVEVDEAGLVEMRPAEPRRS